LYFVTSESGQLNDDDDDEDDDDDGFLTTDVS